MPTNYASSNPSTNFDRWNKHLYSQLNPLSVRLYFLIGLITLLLSTVGLWQLILTGQWFLVVTASLFSVTIISQITSMLLGLLYQPFSIKQHTNVVTSYWNNLNKNQEQAPKVCIFLPICGEAYSITSNTLIAISKVNYPNLEAVCLDDGNRADMKELCQKLGVTYLSRPHRGQYKKSGNLQYGYDNTTSKYVFVLDADFEPHPDCMRDLVPYMEQKGNEKVSMLQTPQFFRLNTEMSKKSPIEYGSGASVEIFYRIMMGINNRFKAGMCVGTSVLVRRQAVIDCGGTPKINGSEDMWLGLLTMRAGYHIKYLPIILSAGHCPDNIESYFKQQSRWCIGTFDTVFHSNFWTTKMTWVARLWYFNCTLFYIGEALTPLWISNLIFLMASGNLRFDWMIFWAYLPLMIFQLVISVGFKLFDNYNANRLIGVTQSFAFLYTIIITFFKKQMAWIPAGHLASKYSVSSDFIKFSMMIGFLTFGYSIGLAISLVRNLNQLDNPGFWLLLATTLYPIIMFWQICHLALNHILRVKAVSTFGVTDMNSKHVHKRQFRIYKPNVMLAVVISLLLIFGLSQIPFLVNQWQSISQRAEIISKLTINKDSNR